MNYRLFLINSFLLLSIFNRAQNLYFPPLSGSGWDTLAPQRFNWCQPRIDSLYNYLQVKNTKSFIVLKDGKIVLEKYFGTYTADSIFYWASAGKSLTGFMAGIAQAKNLINITNPVSQYLGTGWSSAPTLKENQITVKHLLQMTSGLEDAPPLPCDNEDSAKSCLVYKVDAGTRWAYHTGAYKKVQSVISAAAGQNYNLVTNNWVEQKTGMSGFWLNQVYYSKARDMARFGLLNLNRGIWNLDTLLKDSLYFKAMTNTSQSFNQSYGYLWWLNGKSSFMNPGLQFQFNGPIIPNAPADLYAALGKNDQKIYVVPSQNMVVIRQGNSAEGVTFALSNFDNNLWEYMNKLSCPNLTSIERNELNNDLVLYPNPAHHELIIQSNSSIESAYLTNLLGERIELTSTSNKIDVSGIKKGLYVVTILLDNNTSFNKKLLID